jgi:hypothetical protein
VIITQDDVALSTADFHDLVARTVSTYREWGSIAQDLAELRGYRPGDQVRVDPAVDEEPLIWLLAPLVAGASIVIDPLVGTTSPE